MKLIRGRTFEQINKYFPKARGKSLVEDRRVISVNRLRALQ
jgi:hypothetical protein